MTGDEIGFGEVSDVHRNERRSKVLTKLPPHFHELAQEHLRKLREEHCEAVRIPGNPAAMMLWDQVTKVDKRLKMIYELRERKITLAALDRMVGAQMPDNMTRPEKELYEKLVGTLASFRKEAESTAERQCAPGTVAEMPGPVEQEVPVQTSAVRPEPAAAEPARGEQGSTVVHVLEDIPGFAGLSTDYELKKDDMVTLPSQFAALLSSKGKVRIIGA